MSDPQEVPRRTDSSSRDDHPANVERDNTKCPSTEEIHEFLDDSTLFRALPRETLDRLTEIARPSTVNAGRELFHRGQACDALHLLFAGTGLLLQTASDGRQRILHRAVPGEMVGAVAFFDGTGYPATLRAEVDCVFVSFLRDDLLPFLSGASEVSLAIIGGLVSRLRAMVGIVERTRFEDTSHRLWKYLLDLAQSEGDDEFPRVIESLPTRQHIALEIGTVREVVSRRLSRLINQGDVVIDGRRLTLLEPRDRTWTDSATHDARKRKRKRRR